MSEQAMEWREHYFNLARSMAEYSTCVRRKIGAVLVGPEGFAVRAGWNTEHPTTLRCDAGGGGLPAR